MKCIPTRTQAPRHQYTTFGGNGETANKEQCLMSWFFQNNTFRQPFRRTHRNDCVDLVFEMCLKYFECVGSCEHRGACVCVARTNSIVVWPWLARTIIDNILPYPKLLLRSTI